MSDPMNRPSDAPPPPPPPPESLPRKSASPLLWLLVLVALLALGWYFYNQRPIETAVPPPPAAVDASPQPAPSSESPASTTTRPARKAGSTGPARASRINRDPEPVARIQPEYPAQALRNHEEGTVLVRVNVDANGMATNPEVVNRSGSRELDRAAMDAVRRWQFKPALKDGKAIASAVEVPVEFKLDQQ